jgi:hypothetical protein
VLVFGLVRADDLDFLNVYLGSFGDINPRVARDGPRVDAIGNHHPAETKVVFGNSVSNSVPRVVERSNDDPGPANRLLDRIDPQMDCSNLARELSRNRGLSGSRQTTEDNEHC